MQFVVKTWSFDEKSLSPSQRRNVAHIFHSRMIMWRKNGQTNTLLSAWYIDGGFKKQIDDELWSLGKYLPRERTKRRRQIILTHKFKCGFKVSSQRTCVFLQMLMGEWHASNIKWWTLARVVLLLKKYIFLADYKRSQRLDGHELLSSVGWRCNTVFIL